MEEKDKDRLLIIKQDLSIKAFNGCANKCPKCNLTGNFGSIKRFHTSEGIEYLVCGWCGETTET